MSRPRLLLIDPPFYRLYRETYGLCKYPLGVASLAAAVRRETDVEVKASVPHHQKSARRPVLRVASIHGLGRFSASLGLPVIAHAGPRAFRKAKCFRLT